MTSLGDPMKDLLIFDMDGVLVEVTESYRATIQATVKHFTGEEPSRTEIQDWKNRGGWNDDWLLSHRMILERGGKAEYQTVVNYFQKIFHGDGTNGLILREQWVAKDGLFGRLLAESTEQFDRPLQRALGHLNSGHQLVASTRIDGARCSDSAGREPAGITVWSGSFSSSSMASAASAWMPLPPKPAPTR